MFSPFRTSTNGKRYTYHNVTPDVEIYAQLHYGFEMNTLCRNPMRDIGPGERLLIQDTFFDDYITYHQLNCLCEKFW